MPPGLSLTQFKAVLFDVDGTLVDSLQMIIQGLGDTFETFSQRRPTDREIRSLIGMPLSVQLKLYREVEPTEAELEVMKGYAMDRFDVHQASEQPFAEAVQMLRLCHLQGIKTALVTSKSTRELDGFMKRFSGAAFVNATVCASDVSHPKPAPDSALLACNLLAVDPSEAAFVGDSVYDMRCARAAGLTSIGVAYGAANAAELTAESPDLLVHTPAELLQWAQTEFLETTCRVNGT